MTYSITHIDLKEEMSSRAVVVLSQVVSWKHQQRGGRTDVEALQEWPVHCQRESELQRRLHIVCQVRHSPLTYCWLGRKKYLHYTVVMCVTPFPLFPFSKSVYVASWKSMSLSIHIVSLNIIYIFHSNSTFSYPLSLPLPVMIWPSLYVAMETKWSTIE